MFLSGLFFFFLQRVPHIFNHYFLSAVFPTQILSQVLFSFFLMLTLKIPLFLILLSIWLKNYWNARPPGWSSLIFSGNYSLSSPNFLLRDLFVFWIFYFLRQFLSTQIRSVVFVFIYIFFTTSISLKYIKNYLLSFL